MFVVIFSDICVFGISVLDEHIIVIIQDVVRVGVGSHLQALGIFSVAIGNSEILLDPLSSLFFAEEYFFIYTFISVTGAASFDHS